MSGEPLPTAGAPGYWGELPSEIGHAAPVRPVRNAEVRLLRWAAVVLTVLWPVTAVLLARFAATLVSLEAPGDRWAAPGMREWAVGLVPAGVFWLWWGVARRFRDEEVGHRGTRIAPLMAGPLVVGLVSVALVVPGSRWFLLEAVKVRSVLYSYVRSSAFWESDRLDEATGPRVLLVGSSQMNAAVDAGLLAEDLQGYAVEKAVLPGFNIMGYRMAADALEVSRGDVVVTWISEFDVFREERIPAARLRFSASAGGVVDLASSLGWARGWSNRAELADLALASVLPVWRDRDFLRQLVLHAWWSAPTEPSTPDPWGDPRLADRQRENLGLSVRRTALVEANLRSFRTFARTVVERGAELYVFEGHTAPVGRATYDPGLRPEARSRLDRMAAATGFHYVDESEMPDFGQDAFEDVYHLDREAQLRFTSFLGDFLERRLDRRSGRSPPVPHG